MFVLLLLATAVGSDWVEIAQYRQQPRRPIFNGAPTANTIYANYTTTERSNYPFGFTRPNYGSVKRVQLSNKENGVLSTRMASSTSEKLHDNEQYESVGLVRAPSLKTKEDFNDGQIQADLDDLVGHNFGNINDKSKIRTHDPLRRFNLKSDKSQSDVTTNTRIIEKNNVEKSRISVNRGHKIELTDQRNPNIKSVQSANEVVNAKAAQVNKSNVETKFYFKESDKVDNKLKDRIRYTNETLITNTEILRDEGIFSPHSPFLSKPVTDNYNLDKNFERQTKLKGATKFIRRNYSQQNVKRKDHFDTRHADLDKVQNQSDNSKPKTLDVIWKLVNVITDNISRNTRRSFRSKVRYLESLRNNIIANIEERIEQAWPEPPGAGGAGRGRRRRAARGHVEFPSSESALMTISFLTFAVFLIKLVLQVIHTYKNKAMMVTPALVAAVGRAAAALKNQN